MPRQLEKPDAVGGPFRLGDWLVEPSLNRLSRGDKTIQLELKVMDVLVCLAERAGDVVTRNEIVDRVWATEFIADNTLTHAINEIRNALGDDARNPSFIETIHRRGYRLMVPVVVAEQATATVAPFPTQAGPVADLEISPYPGLAAFTETDAEFFFGREDEVIQMWRKLLSRRLLAVIGPSGVGKSSFLRAGVIPLRPAGWGVLVCQPGEGPFAALARALVPEFADDSEALARLVHLQEPSETVAIVSRWRERHDQALLIVDQFEELFTLNPPEIQALFAELLRRLVDDANVHVLLSMRDDFLYRCHDHERLAPIFDSLTPVRSPTAGALRRALVEPAKRMGFAFEDDALAAEMVGEIQGERGALPLLAFAVARLWEKRDREERLLTRQAYADIGGVGGALARHADATLKAIGEHGLLITREVFRNLVTAEGTRAIRSVDTLMSIFPDNRREDAARVLGRLIDARLLTSFEKEGVEGVAIQHSVEVVHESLLSSWPRLVGWRTQDADSARLRDELRRAARAWEDHGRPADWLWVGAQYREFRLWRKRYSGGLSDIEDAFASAMTSFATRRRRRRRIAFAAGTAILLAVLAVVTGLWRQSVRQTSVAEAQKLLALGQLEIERFPTAALAWARASLGVADTREGRLFALKAIANGPIGRVLEFETMTEGVAHDAVFSPDGEWVAFKGYEKLKVHHRSRGPTMVVDTFPTSGISIFSAFFDASGTKLGAWKPNRDRGVIEIRTYELPGFAEVDRDDIQLDYEKIIGPLSTNRGLFALHWVGEEIEIWRYLLGGPLELFDRIDRFDPGFAYLDPFGKWLTCRRGNDIWVHSLEKAGSPPQRIGQLDAETQSFRIDPNLRWIAAENSDTTSISAWPLDPKAPEEMRNFDTRGITGSLSRFVIDDQGRRIAIAGNLDGGPGALVWDLHAPAIADPIALRVPSLEYMNGVTFEPTGRWAVTGNVSFSYFWPLPKIAPVVFPGDGSTPYGLLFSSDGSEIFAGSSARGIRILPTTGGAPERGLPEAPKRVIQCALDRSGRYVAVTGYPATVRVIPLDGSKARHLEGFDRSAILIPVAYHPDGELVAAAAYRGPRDQKVIRVWNLKDNSVRILGPTDDAGDEFDGGFLGLEFLPDGRLLSSGTGGVRRWNLDDGSSELLFTKMVRRVDLSPDGNAAAVTIEVEEIGGRRIALIDLRGGEVRQLEEFGNLNTNCTFGPRSDLFATASRDGTIRVGRLSGDEPHILYGHPTKIEGLTFSPDGRWLASGDLDGIIRLWPVPDVSKPAPHTLPHDEFLAKLDSFTNLRVVRDEASPTGWNLEVGPFTGWAEVPEW